MLKVLSDEELVRGLLDAAADVAVEGEGRDPEEAKTRLDGHIACLLKTLEFRQTAERAAAEKWMGYERDFILPAFKFAESIGFDLHKAVTENPGKNCCTLLWERLRDDRAQALRFSAADNKARNTLLEITEVEVKAHARRISDLERALTSVVLALSTHGSMHDAKSLMEAVRDDKKLQFVFREKADGLMSMKIEIVEEKR
jgi:hypothetical protein